MPIWTRIKNSDHEAHLISKRIVTAGVFVVLFFLIITYRVFNLQINMHDHYTTLSQSNRVKVVPIAPTRGLIFSNDGVLLADNRPSFSLEMIPEKVENVDRLIEHLVDVIGMDDTAISQFRDRLRQKRRFDKVPILFNMSDEEVARISIDLHRFPGVDIAARLNRYYPLGANFAHTIGYVGMIDQNELTNIDKSNYSATTHIGKLGVERAYEELLHGQVGYQQVEVNALGRIVRVLDRTPPVPGKNVYITLNASLQNVAVQAMDGRRGAVVAIDPDTGGVLAMVSAPGYDPNPFVYGIDAKSYNSLLRSASTPLVNRVLQGTYPPGSTIKPVLALAALHYGVRNFTDTTWCPGWYTLKGTSLRKRDWKKEGHGHTNMRKAIAESCDVYYYALAHDLGIDRMHEYMSQFSFGQRTGIDIGGESAALLPSREWKRRTRNESWYPGETINMGIGQGAMLATPIQLALSTAVIANRGRVVTPHFFDEAKDPLSGDTVKEYTPGEVPLIRHNEVHWNNIISSMEDVMHGATGTARASARGAEYRYAGKSGTAQVFSLAFEEEYDASKLAQELHDHALFIAFAPLESPRIAVAIIVENGGGGSAIAAPIARQLFDNYLEQLQHEASLSGYETADVN
jgi:penicillin-binding protein 2